MSDEHSKIKEIEDAMAKAKYNKATEKWFALMKSQIAKLREKIEKKSSGKGGGTGWFVKKTGDATVVLVGYPSVGKSTLLNAVTGAESKTGAYEFTTLDCIPGTLNYEGAKIQILDVPGIISGASIGKGRGKEVLAMSRTADLILFVVDAKHPEHYPSLQKEVYDVGIRVNENKPDVKIVKKSKGGMSVHSTVKLTHVDSETLETVLKEFKLMNSDVVIRDNVTIDQFIDAIKGNRAYVRSLICVSKADLLSKEEKAKLKKKFNNPIFVSSTKDIGIDDLKEILYKELKFLRIYLKEVNKKPDLDEPMVLTAPVTVETVCKQIHRDFIKKFRFARIWGKSAKFPGQQVQKLDKELTDGDIVEIHVR
jgi:small GTP-binding protein